MPRFDDEQYSSFLRMMKNFCKDFPGTFACRSHFLGEPESVWDPPADIYETEQAVVIRLEIAGAKREDIDVKYAEDQLRIRGSRREPEGICKIRIHQMELPYCAFDKVIANLPPVNEAKLSASYDNGFLTVTLPKKPLKKSEIKVERE